MIVVNTVNRMRGERIKSASIVERAALMSGSHEIEYESRVDSTESKSIERAMCTIHSIQSP